MPAPDTAPLPYRTRLDLIGLFEWQYDYSVQQIIARTPRSPNRVFQTTLALQYRDLLALLAPSPTTWAQLKRIPGRAHPLHDPMIRANGPALRQWLAELREYVAKTHQAQHAGRTALSMEANSRLEATETMLSVVERDVLACALWCDRERL